MRCPKCQSETGRGAIRCADCGAPLALGDEAPLRPLDQPLDLDRRGGREGAPGAPPAVGPPGPGERPGLRPASPDDLSAGPGARVLAVPPPGTVIELTRGDALRRVGAWLIDGLPFAFLVPALATALGATELRLLLPLAGVAALASFTYQTLLTWLVGATVGKRLLRLRVVGPDGERPGPGRSALRACVAVLGVLCLGAGPLLALFTRSGHALHDLVAGTTVVEAP